MTIGSCEKLSGFCKLELLPDRVKRKRKPFNGKPYQTKKPKDKSQSTESIVKKVTKDLFSLYQGINDREKKFFVTPDANTNKMPPPKELLRNYVYDGILGEGTHSFVFRSFHIPTGEQVALKVKKPTAREFLFRREQGFYKKLEESPYVVNLIDYTSEKDGKENIALELLEGKDLYNEFLKINGSQERKKMSMLELMSFVKQMSWFLIHSKETGVCHADLKPANINFNNGVLKVMDFGIAFDVSDKNHKYIIQSPFYRAIENFLKTNSPGLESDMWSLGCILYELYTQKPLFSYLLSFEENSSCYHVFFHLFVYYLGYPEKTFIDKFDPEHKIFDVSEEGVGLKCFDSCQIKRDIEDYDKKLKGKGSYIELQILNEAKKRGDSKEQALELVKLITSMLRYENRITPEKLSKEKFCDVDIEKVKEMSKKNKE